VNIAGQIRRHKEAALITVGLALLSLMFITANYIFIGSYKRYVVSTVGPGQGTVGIVLGGGIKNNRPTPLLQDRLDAGAELLLEGKVKKLILSGDNRFEGYNEPEVMKSYLVREKGLDEKLIQLDQAGRSTYETCERAHKIFGLNKAVLVSESTHLPRAIYLCRMFGIESYGYASDGKAIARIKISQSAREILARTKATLNVFVIGEKTVLGDRITL